MSNEITEWLSNFLDELVKISEIYNYQILHDKISADLIEDTKYFFEVAAENITSELEFITQCDNRFMQLEEALGTRASLHSEWVTPEENTIAVNYIYTDDLAALKDNLKTLSPSIRKKFKQRLEIILSDFTLENNYDDSKFEPANNHQTDTKDACKKILSANGVDGTTWEIKCSGENVAVRFPAVQDITNHKWFILSTPYLHRNNDKKAHEEWLKKAATSYCNNINNLETIPDTLLESLENYELIELDRLAEQLYKLLEL